FRSCSVGSAPPRGEREKGKPGESRGRKAPRLPHSVRVPCRSSHRSSRKRGLMFSRAPLLWVLTLLTAVTACSLKPRPTGPGSDIARVVVLPESVALGPQQTQPFRAAGITAAGDTVPTNFDWRASGGTVSP